MTEKIKSILDVYPLYEATIGIEVHVQLNTKSKMFCACPNIFGRTPNSNICQVCAGHPGILPVPNAVAVDYAIMAGLATGCTISPTSRFSRKHYRYPDSPKNYQITQGEVAICHDGQVLSETRDGEQKYIRIQRIHMEEDAGKVHHMPHGKSFVDINRAGTPLLEIVTHPDIADAHEAKQYLMNLRAILIYLGITDGNMEEGSFRADINISVKKKSDSVLGTRAEVKNVNSFKFIGMAIDYEIERQIEVLSAGGTIIQETRLWNEKNQVTRSMRAKSNADDYRYFDDPDLPVIHVDDVWLERIRQNIPELPLAKRDRLVEDYGLSIYEADILVQDQALANFFEEGLRCGAQPKGLCNWMLRDLLSYLNIAKLSLKDSAVTPQTLADLVQCIDRGVINTKTGQEVFGLMVETQQTASELIKERGLEQVSDVGELDRMCATIVSENQEVVEKYKAGQERLFGFLVGLVMKATKGKANPQMVNELLKKHIQ